MGDSGGRPGYRVYTKAFDRVVTADKLDTVLGAMSLPQAVQLQEAWDAFQTGLLAWKTKANIAALAMSEDVRRRTTDDARASTVVLLLIDQSGSMRGQSMLMAAAAADVAQDVLRHLGCAVEVLGFTTVSWRGGRARRRWRWRLRPKSPGRLCELLHIIYRAPGDPGSGADAWSFRSMLRPDLPKENVDGEALEWAVGRLRARPERRKILVVVSDGAPVDDSTLHENGPHFLEDHLLQVIASTQQAGDVELAALGIGFDVSRYYPRAAVIQTPADLGDAMIEMLGDLLKAEAPD